MTILPNRHIFFWLSLSGWHWKASHIDFAQCRVWTPNFHITSSALYRSAFSTPVAHLLYMYLYLNLVNCTPSSQYKSTCIYWISFMNLGHTCTCINLDEEIWYGHYSMNKWGKDGTGDTPSPGHTFGGQLKTASVGHSFSFLDWRYIAYICTSSSSSSFSIMAINCHFWFKGMRVLFEKRRFLPK